MIEVLHYNVVDSCDGKWNLGEGRRSGLANAETALVSGLRLLSRRQQAIARMTGRDAGLM
ncbi:BQ5605_C011g06519 [Microbotryum silenes-dioicae]|uniref:BQ5605_C011g06519 protein n=1 Tax=Microbotryum silenes-dioicae TaxID=796604 RepID=A0A2X0NT69_9BASI|nr:BQ5605_C011g06519 [Microbotryum silenes-dioicae]